MQQAKQVEWKRFFKGPFSTSETIKKIAKCLLKLPKNDFTGKMIDLTHLQKLLKNVGDLGKLKVTKGFKKLPKVQ